IIAPAPGMGPTDTLFTKVSCDTIVTPPSHLGITALNHSDVKIYPNPATDELTIMADVSKYRAYTIRNAVGQEFIQSKIVNSQTTIDVSILPRGIYLIELIGPNDQKTIG